MSDEVKSSRQRNSDTVDGEHWEDGEKRRHRDTLCNGDLVVEERSRDDVSIAEDDDEKTRQVRVNEWDGERERERKMRMEWWQKTKDLIVHAAVPLYTVKFKRDNRYHILS